MIPNLKSFIIFSHEYHFTQCKQKVTTEVIDVTMKNEIFKVTMKNGIFKVKTITMNRKKNHYR